MCTVANGESFCLLLFAIEEVMHRVQPLSVFFLSALETWSMCLGLDAKFLAQEKCALI
jgi:hypothetical protein